MQAAIDDAGMQYVSAVEGLSGSIRVRAFDREQDFGAVADLEPQPQVAFASSRIIYRGESALPALGVLEGLHATYFMEFRPGDGRETLTGRYLDVGLRGPFGHVRFGEIQSVSDAIVPSADRTSDVGTSGRSLVEDYDKGIRWVSPEIKGVVLGLSADTNSDDFSDSANVSTGNLADKYDVVARYNSPLGLDVGVSYALVRSAKASDEEIDRSGVRAGLTYSYSNWGIGYNFHNYRGLSAPETGSARALGSKLEFLNYFKVITTVGGETRDPFISDFDKLKHTRYKEHVIGANYDYGKFRISYLYSRASIKNEPNNFEVGFVNQMSDVAYRLGSKSKLVLAYRYTKMVGDNIVPQTISNDPRLRLRDYYLLYRVDF